jgi:hypothetical protein
MHTHTAGALGEFRGFFCYACNKAVQKWFLHFEPVETFSAVPCPICGKPALLLREELARAA